MITPPPHPPPSITRSEPLSSPSPCRHSNDSLLRLQSLPRARSLPPFSKPDLGHLPDAAPPPGPQLDASLTGALNFYSTLQSDDGHWPGDYGGPMFLMPGLIIAAYVTGCMDTALPPPHRAEMVRYLVNHQNEDGGYGLHIEGDSTMFGTCLSYVSMRLLGMAADAPETARARAWMHARGGAPFITSWGKFWLAVLGVYEWSGLNPMPPEMWLLPYWLPMHPGRFWCHCRMVRGAWGGGDDREGGKKLSGPTLLRVLCSAPDFSCQYAT